MPWLRRDLRPLGGFTVDRSVIRFNDGKPDPWGNFWVGTMAWDEQNGPPCIPYCLAPDGRPAHAGDIFACTPGVTGRPPYLFGA